MIDNLKPLPTGLTSTSVSPTVETSARTGVSVSRLRPTAGKLPLFLGFVLLLVAPLHAADESDLPGKLLGLTDEFSDQLANAARQRLIEIAPVNLPVNPPGDCNHYGWPIATMIDDTMIVMHRRIPGHKASGAGSTAREDVVRHRVT